MKRKFSLLVAAACLFSSITFGGVAHADTPSSFTDVTNKTQYYEGIMTLTKLGVINGYTEDNGATYSFKPEGEITRAEFSKIIITALGADASVGSSDKFTDIDSHWAKGFIIAAAERGIVNGMGDGTFAPDSKVTYEQAVKMIVCAAGYENQAQAFGGWPNGYLTQASNLGITKDAVSTNTTAPAARGIIAQLMYNVLEVNVPEYDINGSLKNNLKTFMETYLGIIKEKATIVGVEDKKLASFTETLYIDEMAVMLRDGTVVKMDFSSYTDDKSVLEERIGQAVVVYYKEGKSGSQNSLYELDFESSKNTVTVINSEDISDYSSNTLKYYDENGKLRSFKIDPSTASVYYNGKLAASPASKLAEVLDPNQTSTFMYGEVKLTDSGSDKSIDIVEITDYEYMVVSKTPSTTDYKVVNKVKFSSGSEFEGGYIPDIELDPESFYYTVNITNASGDKVSPTSLKANNVLMVALSEDEEIRTVVVSSASVTGKITAKSSSDNAITISGKEYKISKFAEAYFEGKVKTDVGSQGTFYLDGNNCIVYGTQSYTSQSTNPYAYIIRATYDEDDETSGTIYAYVPSASALKTYNLKSKVKYNGVPTTKQEAIEKLKNNAESAISAIVPDKGKGVYSNSAEPDLSNACQMARLTLDGTQVEEIFVVDSTYQFPETPATSDDIIGIVPYTEMLGETEYVSSGNFDGQFYVNQSTTFIFIPKDRSDTASYAKKSMSSFKSGASYWVQPYNVNSSKFANLVLVFGDEIKTVAVSKTDTPRILVKDHGIENIDDEQVYEVQYFDSSAEITKNYAKVDGNLMSGASSNAIDIKDVKAGDFFRTGTDSSSRLVNAEVAVSVADVKAAIEAGRDFSDSKFTWLSGTTENNSLSKIIVANIVEVTEDGKQLRITTDGMVDGAWPETLSDNLVNVDSAVIYRITDDGEVTPFVEGSDNKIITVDSLKDIVDNGTAANTIAMYSYKGVSGANRTCKMILIYK